MKEKMKNRAVVLMSGGLDSLTALACAVDEGFEVVLALTFNYNQRALKGEVEAAERICKVYGIKHEVVDLSFLGKISSSALNNADEELKFEFENLGSKSAEAVWVPNRNGLFLNIAAAFAESYKLNYIIFGANKEEGETFSDNTKEFVEAINNEFKYSTLSGDIKVFAPLVELKKHEIVERGLKLNVNFELLKSCYTDFEKLENGIVKRHCGECESCLRLKNAILKTGNIDLIKKLF